MFKMMAFSVTHASSRARHWSTALSITPCGIDDVMATRHLRHCEILQGSGGGSSMWVGEKTQGVWGTEVLQRGPGAEPR